jgi:outer membrane biosynthesis protein TonB
MLLAPTVGAIADNTNIPPAASTSRQGVTNRVVVKQLTRTEHTNALEKVTATNAAFQLRATARDEKATRVFKVYDDTLIAAVQQRWYDLLDDQGYEGYKPGTVRVEFKLHSDGKITDLRVTENTVSKALRAVCEKAVSGGSPYDRWPKDMREKLGKEVREIVFTFYYN